MWRNKIITFSLVVFGALLITAVAPDSRWAWNAQDHIDVPTVSAAWTEFEPAIDENGGLTQITIASPPYIILGTPLNIGGRAVVKDQIRITIKTMSGTYSEYVASRPATPAGLPVVYAGSVKLGISAGPPLDLTVWR